MPTKGRFATTRFAPSPTGYLHLGHVAHAIYVWGIAGLVGARVILRIEDHDRIRSRQHFADAILEDLAWLGFAPDLGLNPVRRQSDRNDVYRRALATLQREFNVYACDCSRKEIASERYSGRCRARRLSSGALPSAGVGIRVQLDDRTEHFDDLATGPNVQTPAAQCGDLLLRDRDGHWTYQFAVTVDDIDDNVDLVVRGLDLLSSTGRQIALARMLGRSLPPTFFHHPLIVDVNGDKLSKVRGDTGVRDLRAAGVTAPEVIARAAAAVGLSVESTALGADTVTQVVRQHGAIRGRI